MWLRCNSDGLRSPNRSQRFVVAAIKGVAPFFAAREGLGEALIGGGLGKAKGPYQFYTGSGAAAAGGGNRIGRFCLWKPVIQDVKGR